MKARDVINLCVLAAVLIFVAAAAMMMNEHNRAGARASAGGDIIEPEEFSIEVMCERIQTVVHLPTVTYSVTTHRGLNTCEITTSIIDAVNQDQAPVAECVGARGGFVISHPTPLFKISGLQCSDNQSIKVAVNGGGLPHPELGIAIQPYGEIKWNEKHRVNHLTSIERVTIAELSDCDDFDGTCNGEIVFGGEAATGGTTTVIFMRPMPEQAGGARAGSSKKPDTFSDSITFTFSK